MPLVGLHVGTLLRAIQSGNRPQAGSYHCRKAGIEHTRFMGRGACVAGWSN